MHSISPIPSWVHGRCGFKQKRCILQCETKKLGILFEWTLLNDHDTVWKDDVKNKKSDSTPDHDKKRWHFAWHHDALLVTVMQPTSIYSAGQHVSSLFDRCKIHLKIINFYYAMCLEITSVFIFHNCADFLKLAFHLQLTFTLLLLV